MLMFLNIDSIIRIHKIINRLFFFDLLYFSLNQIQSASAHSVLVIAKTQQPRLAVMCSAGISLYPYPVFKFC